MNIAVVGVTGMVGRTILEVLTERNVTIDQLIPVASEKSIGQSITFNGQQWPICTIEEALTKPIDIALFSAEVTFQKNMPLYLLKKEPMLSIIHRLSEWMKVSH